MYEERPPFISENKVDEERRVKIKTEDPVSVNVEISQKFLSLLMVMLNKDPFMRLSAEPILSLLGEDDQTL